MWYKNIKINQPCIMQCAVHEFRKKKKSEGKEEDKNGQLKAQRYVLYIYLHKLFF